VWQQLLRQSVFVLHLAVHSIPALNVSQIAPKVVLISMQQSLEVVHAPPGSEQVGVVDVHMENAQLVLS
jgi:hypothetical protein